MIKPTFKNIFPWRLFLSFAVAFVTVLVNLAVTPVFASETLTFIHSDHLGSTAMVTDDQGNVISRQSYYPYGETRAREPERCRAPVYRPGF